MSRIKSLITRAKIEMLLAKLRFIGFLIRKFENDVVHTELNYLTGEHHTDGDVDVRFGLTVIKVTREPMNYDWHPYVLETIEFDGDEDYLDKHIIYFMNEEK